MTQTTLYDYWRSSASYRVRIALNLAKESYTTVVVDLLNAEHQSEAHKQRHPQGYVPVLDIDGVRLTQSLAILDYLHRTRTHPLLPESPALSAQIQALAHTLAVDVHPVCNLNVVRHVAQLQTEPDDVRTLWMARFIRPGLEAFETQLTSYQQRNGHTHFCAGESPGLADVCLIPQLYNAQRWGVDFTDCEKIVSIKQACDELQAFSDAHPNAVDTAD